MKIELNGKEYNIKFGYKPTLKERIISKVVKLGDVTGENDEVDMEKVEDLLLFLPERLLVGLQVNHNDFRYDYDTKEGKGGDIFVRTQTDFANARSFCHRRRHQQPPRCQLLPCDG